MSCLGAGEEQSPSGSGLGGDGRARWKSVEDKQHGQWIRRALVAVFLEGGLTATRQTGCYLQPRTLSFFVFLSTSEAQWRHEPVEGMDGSLGALAFCDPLRHKNEKRQSSEAGMAAGRMERRIPSIQSGHLSKENLRSEMGMHIHKPGQSSEGGQLKVCSHVSD